MFYNKCICYFIGSKSNLKGQRSFANENNYQKNVKLRFCASRLFAFACRCTGEIAKERKANEQQMIRTNIDLYKKQPHH